MYTIKSTITEKKDTIILHFNVEELKKLPLKAVFKTLELVEKNNRLLNLFVEFDPQTKKFIEENQEQYKKEVTNENDNFKKLSQVFFDQMSGPLYVYPLATKNIVL